MKILITGAAGFIGSHISRNLAESGHEVTGVDSLNDYYDPGLKFNRLSSLTGIRANDISCTGFAISHLFSNYRFMLMDICNRHRVEELFRKEVFDAVCHFAAQPGVRYSLEEPFACTNANINGFLTILEGCRRRNIKRLLFASSSSVYGDNENVPFTEDTPADKPLSLYAATKKANELMAYSYSHLFGFKVTAMRFFTVYGPWGRPDMAPWLFTKAITEGTQIKLFNEGNLFRDFTYIDDVTASVTELLRTEFRDSSSANPCYSVYNIGNRIPVSVKDFIKCIEKSTGLNANLENHPMQQGDVHITCADTERLYLATGIRPATPVETGVENFVRWYMGYTCFCRNPKDFRRFEYERN